MRNLIYTAHSKETFLLAGDKSLGYILAPGNNMVVKVIHNENAPPSMPIIDISVSSSDLRLRLESGQHEQLMFTANILAALEQKKRLLSCRPLVSPQEDPLSWWRYAVQLALQTEETAAVRVSIIFIAYSILVFLTFS